MSRVQRVEYYKAAADHWRDAIRLQKDRCQSIDSDPRKKRHDLEFYVVSVQRLIEVGRQIRDRLRSPKMKGALKSFEERWPRFKELRNVQEHMTGPSGDYPLGILYFDHAATNLKTGSVEYVVHIHDMEHSVEMLYSAICDALGPETTDA